MRTKKKMTSVYLEEDLINKIKELSENIKDETFSSLLRKIIHAGIKSYN